MNKRTLITVTMEIALVVGLAGGFTLLAWPTDSAPASPNPASVVEVAVQPSETTTTSTTSAPEILDAVGPIERTTTTSTQVKRATTTTSEVPPPLTPEQEATIGQGMQGDTGQYCPDVCEDVDWYPIGETEGMGED